MVTTTHDLKHFKDCIKYVAYYYNHGDGLRNYALLNRWTGEYTEGLDQNYIEKIFSDYKKTL
jgi:hypothetical protein